MGFPSFRSVGILRIFKRGIFIRTFTSHIIISLTTIVLIIIAATIGERSTLLRGLESQAKMLSASIAEVSSNAFTSGNNSLIANFSMELQKKSPDILYIIVVRYDGSSFVCTSQKCEYLKKHDPTWENLLKIQKSGIFFSRIVNGNTYNYISSIRSSGTYQETLLLGLSLVHYKKQMAIMYKVFILLSIVCFAITAIISYFLARRFTSPIILLQDTTRKIADGDLTARARISTGDEVENLSVTFNKMADAMMESRQKIMAAYSELETYKRDLEVLVRQRTEELTKTNKRLEQELNERRRAEDALTESEHMYRTIFETTGNAAIITDENNIITMVNTGFEKLSGFTKEEVEGKKTWMEFIEKSLLPKMKHNHEMRRINPDSVPKGYETRLVDREGIVHEVYISTGLIPGSTKAVASFLDLTDLKRLESQLMQSQKMEAIGQLAGGVAHDFNNILTAIIGYGSLLQMKASCDPVVNGYADQIIASANRAANLTQGLLAFSRKQTITPKPIDLNDIIKNVEKLLRRLIGEDVELKTTFADSAMTIFADAGQIEQILINLAANARDAMADGGFLSIRTETVKMDEKTAEQHGIGDPGAYALITVSDTGQGMDRKILEHIFEPFFTTKESGKGTGLGLSIVYGVVKQHNGYINVYSEPAIGTTFKIYLPIILQQAKEEKTLTRKIPTGGNETILVAEDDEFIRLLFGEILRGYGYSIIEASDGEDAIARFPMHKEHIDLLILDVIMPKKNGKIVYDSAKAIRPDIKALFISGYTADIIHKKGIFEGDLNFLNKPIVPDELALKVREVLDSSR